MELINNLLTIKSKVKNVKEDEKLIDLGEDVDGWVNNY